MSKKIFIKEAEEQSFEDKIKGLDDKLNNLQDKSKEIGNQIVNSKTQAAAASAQASRAVGVTPEAEAQDKKMKSALAAKSRADLKYYQGELAKVKDEINMVNQEKANLLKNKNTQKENIMAKISKRQIIEMLQSAEPARMTKSQLIESITNSILNEGINDDIKRKLESGENDYSKYLDSETAKKMADEIMNDVKSNLESKVGRGANLQRAQEILSQGLMAALQKESRHKRQLEQLAIKLVREEYDIPEDAVDFEAEITGHPQMGGTEIRKENLKMKKGSKRPPQGKTEEELKPNIAKRKLMNAMMHGAARKGQNLFHMASDDLNRISPGLVQDYSKLMAGNDFMYWALDDETIANESESGTHAGQVRVSVSGEKPKIIAQGMTFPFLLHELTKGVLELISLHGLEADKETRDYVLDKTDNLESEAWDIRMGPKIWEKILEAMDVDALPYKSQIIQKLAVLPAQEFNNIIHGLLRDDAESVEEIKSIVYDVIRENNEDALEQSLSQYREPEDEGGDTETPEGPEGPEEDDELARILKGADNPENWSKRDLEDARDEALDSEDYKLVAYYQTLIDRKS
jgi:hypothetical protein